MCLIVFLVFMFVFVCVFGLLLVVLVLFFLVIGLFVVCCPNVCFDAVMFVRLCLCLFGRDVVRACCFDAV